MPVGLVRLRMRDLSPEVVNRPVWVLRAAEGMWYEATVVALGVGMRECTVVYAESGNRSTMDLTSAIRSGRVAVPTMPPSAALPRGHVAHPERPGKKRGGRGRAKRERDTAPTPGRASAASPPPRPAPPSRPASRLSSRPPSDSLAPTVSHPPNGGDSAGRPKTPAPLAAVLHPTALAPVPGMALPGAAGGSDTAPGSAATGSAAPWGTRAAPPAPLDTTLLAAAQHRPSAFSRPTSLLQPPAAPSPRPSRPASGPPSQGSDGADTLSGGRRGGAAVGSAARLLAAAGGDALGALAGAGVAPGPLPGLPGLPGVADADGDAGSGGGVGSDSGIVGRAAACGPGSCSLSPRAARAWGRRPVHEAFAPDAAAEEPPSKLPRLAFQRPLSGTPGANGRGDVTPGRGDSDSVGDGSGGVEGRTRGRLSAGEVRGRSHSGDEGRVRSMPRGNAEGTGSVGPGSRLAMGAGGMGGGFLNAAGVAGSLGQGARPGDGRIAGLHRRGRSLLGTLASGPHSHPPLANRGPAPARAPAAPSALPWPSAAAVDALNADAAGAEALLGMASAVVAMDEDELKEEMRHPLDGREVDLCAMNDIDDIDFS